ncbi:hypothetical protein [Silvimonas sp.]|uniref:hypothetical protein n=1 Tax=Silvimonas sp. TaxID=2650811 RepID=UPI002850C20F|nr:hypothetical protein [Silvimonas sp.]MDR3426067.1 hypothetical protein [Silvimonas sp.]
MVDLDRDKAPDSKWFWILLLVVLFGVVLFWFTNPLGSIKVPATGGPTSQSTDVDPAEQDSSSVPLTLPSTAG